MDLYIRLVVELSRHESLITQLLQQLLSSLDRTIHPARCRSQDELRTKGLQNTTPLRLILSGIVRTRRYPFTAATIAKATPVLPEVGSTIVIPGRRRPSPSAASTIAIPIRSFTLPAGLKYSTLPRIVALPDSETLLSRTIGVFPTRSIRSS